MTLGERIKEYRINNQMSQEDFAEKMHVSRQAITKWESDKGVPDIDNLIHLSRMMNITLDELVLGENCEQTYDIEKQVEAKRINEKKGYLIGIIGFSIAIVFWVISCILNISNGNDGVAIINAACSIILFVPVAKLLKCYLDMNNV